MLYCSREQSKSKIEYSHSKPSIGIVHKHSLCLRWLYSRPSTRLIACVFCTFTSPRHRYLHLDDKYRWLVPCSSGGIGRRMTGRRLGCSIMQGDYTRTCLFSGRGHVGIRAKVLNSPLVKSLSTAQSQSSKQQTATSANKVVLRHLLNMRGLSSNIQSKLRQDKTVRGLLKRRLLAWELKR